MSKHPFKGEPRPHQIRALKKAWPHNEFAFFHAMRSGKTYTTINLAAARFLKDQIDGLVIICPTPLKAVWVRELEQWCPVDVSTFVVAAGCKKRFERWHGLEIILSRLDVMIVGIEALSQGQAHLMVHDFLKSHNCMTVIDESTGIKNAQSGRTKKCFDIGGLSEYRLILTGTPVTQGLHDLYAQMMFLNAKILGCKSYFVFKNRYCVMGGFQGKKILGYQFEDDLMAKIGNNIDQVTKEEAMPNLPANDYDSLTVDLTKEQTAAIKTLKDEMAAVQGDNVLTVATIMEQLTRYQQIIGGNFPFDDGAGNYEVEPIRGVNPKLAALLDHLSVADTSTKFIIWARFRPELAAISDALASAFGEESLVQFHGGIDDEGRSDASLRFQSDDSVRFMVSNQTVGGKGQEWSAADAMVYFSNTFSYEDRKQSEERAIHTDKRTSIFYLDIIANHPADKMITTALKKKLTMAEWVEDQLDEGKEIEL